MRARRRAEVLQWREAAGVNKMKEEPSRFLFNELDCNRSDRRS